MTIPHGGVGLEWLAGALRILTKRHGEKMCGPAEDFQEFLKALAKAEHHYRRLLDREPDKRSKRPCRSGSS